MTYEDLFWSMITSLAQPLVVFTLLTIVLDWCRSLLFYQK